MRTSNRKLKLYRLLVVFFFCFAKSFANGFESRSHVSSLAKKLREIIIMDTKYLHIEKLFQPFSWLLKFSLSRVKELRIYLVPKFNSDETKQTHNFHNKLRLLVEVEVEGVFFLLIRTLPPTSVLDFPRMLPGKSTFSPQSHPIKTKPFWVWIERNERGCTTRHKYSTSVVFFHIFEILIWQPCLESHPSTSSNIAIAFVIKTSKKKRNAMRKVTENTRIRNSPLLLMLEK